MMKLQSHIDILELGNYTISLNEKSEITKIYPVKVSKGYSLDIDSLFRDKPEMFPEEVEYILNKINKDSLVLEWGSGGSTLFFANYCKELHSIEHNFLFYIITKTGLYHKNLLDKVKLHFVEPHESITKGCSYEQVKDYVDIIDKIGITKYNIVIIDGRGRKFCAEKAYDYIDENSFIFLLEYFDAQGEIDNKPCQQNGRDWYRTDKIKELYNIEQCKSMAILTKKKK
jgi:hypothetical protein